MEYYVEQDECSFVSLRDVDRAMLVLEYFYEKRSLYGEHIKKWTDTHLEGKDRKDVLDYVSYYFSHANNYV